MSFWDWLTGGNAKVAAHELVQLHKRCGGDYANVMTLAMTALIVSTSKGTIKRKDVIILDCVFSRLIRNYVDLAVLLLYSNAAPDSQNYDDTYTEFSGKIRSFLFEYGIPKAFIDDDNRKYTDSIVEKIRKELGIDDLFQDS